MEMVAASKMRKAQNAALAGRPYALELEQLIQNLVSYTQGQFRHPFFANSASDLPKKNILFVLFTADRGLCGGFNTNLIRYLMPQGQSAAQVQDLVCVGQKGLNFFKNSGAKIIAEFSNLSDQPDYLATTPLTKLLMEEFLQQNYSEIRLVYNYFMNTMTQKVTEKILLPLQPIKSEAVTPREYLFEPSPQAVLERILPRYLETIVYQTLLESIASEQSARMVAMKSATENAGELIDTLTLELNKARQASITTEILEIVGGAEALKT